MPQVVKLALAMSSQVFLSDKEEAHTVAERRAPSKAHRVVMLRDIRSILSGVTEPSTSSQQKLPDIHTEKTMIVS